ncbi:putative transcription factor bHLH041 isoform X2 [Miscanthus floridulus]|uniref:putative transcription factor bHLH041 isoform X2 n=1 Tax=Miscanthus floridulus TaxID=154761 RepID=UPI003457870A
MDAIFSLAAGTRARVLERAAARIPGCLYICLWAPMIAGPLPSSHLFCVDAWITNDGGGRVRAVLDEYRRAFCAIVSGCVPGWAYKDGRPYMELSETDLTSSASLPVQLQFYHEAGTKMAVFMGCDNGEIEVGLSSTSAPAVASHVQHSLLEELMQAAPTVPSSSSSSMPSLSIGSPEYSSFIRSMATSAAASASAATGAAEPSSQELQLHPAVPLLPGLPAPVYGPHGQAPFLDPNNEQAAMTQAILAVISSSAPPPPASIAVPPASSFRAYNAALSPRARPRPGARGQRMIKTAIALMASVQMAMRHRELSEARQHEDASAAAQPPPPTQQQHSSSQLHHMFSERRRRERLNESFQTLRALLPLGTKKDKATVLANTTEYMNKLIAEVSELKDRNRRLETQLGLLPGETQQTPSDDDPPQRVVVDVTTAASTSSSTSCQPQEVCIRVTVRAECDLSEVVVAMLARIKEMGRFTVVTVDARQRSSDHAQVGITLRATGGNDELDETSLKEAVAKAVEDAVARPPSPP